MKLQFKNIKSYKKSTKNPVVYFDEAIGKIKEMAKLYNIPNLNDEEMTNLASSFYELKLDGEDYTVLAGMALRNQNLECKRLHTSIVVQLDGEVVSLQAVSYVKKGFVLDQNKIYSKEELQRLIQSGDLVIAFFSGCLRNLGEVTISGHNEEIKGLNPINGIILNNLGIYQKYLVTSIKRALSLDRISKDADGALAQVRIDLNEYRALLQDMLSFLANSYNGLASEARIFRDYDLALRSVGIKDANYDQSEVFTPEDCDYGVTPSSR